MLEVLLLPGPRCLHPAACSFVACSLLPAPCCLVLTASCHSHCWTKQASAGICSRGCGPATASIRDYMPREQCLNTAVHLKTQDKLEGQKVQRELQCLLNQNEIQKQKLQCNDIIHRSGSSPDRHSEMRSAFQGEKTAGIKTSPFIYPENFQS
ncbi:hypothetical protein AV530_011793 [Patagioenas fasciata monilis]|uniref:Uncharacterized protein n=1 Tax=Patagioenas fasciata monilis TaxID=372326 RepID=A0A1V4KLP7_PATFA|nr:hypothetical protein AV530_011793 [Patagioenas fasciata monilis]